MALSSSPPPPWTWVLQTAAVTSINSHCRGQWRNVAVACFTTGDHQFKSACIRITNQIEEAAMALTESWFPASPGIFSWLQLYLKCSVYTLTAGLEAAAAEYQVILSSESEPKELCNASMFNLQGSLALPCKLQLSMALHRRERRGHLWRKIEQTEPDTLIPGWDWEKVSKVVAWNFCQCLVGPSIQFFSLKVVLMLGGIICIVSIKRLIVCH